MNSQYRIEVSLQRQDMQVWRAGKLYHTYRISTGKNGAGERYGSECTPRGLHQIRAKIGAGEPENTVFVRRRPTGELYTPALGQAHPGRDWIITRILWLSGLEPGRNRFGTVDTAKRKIYIHGTPGQTTLGVPGSRGCIRMANQDIIEFFDYIPVHTIINIEE